MASSKSTCGVSVAAAARLSAVSAGAGAGARGRGGTRRVTGGLCGVEVDATEALDRALGVAEAIETSVAGSSVVEGICAAGAGGGGASLASEALSCDILALAVTSPTITSRRPIPEQAARHRVRAGFEEASSTGADASMGTTSSVGTGASTSAFTGSTFEGGESESTSNIASCTLRGGSCSSCGGSVARLSRESRTRSRRSSILVSSWGDSGPSNADPLRAAADVLLALTSKISRRR